MKWQLISEAPRDGTRVLVYGKLRVRSDQTPVSYMDVCLFWRGRWTVEWMDGYAPPTHFMLLPEPPEKT